MQLAPTLIQLESRTPEKIRCKTSWKRNNWNPGLQRRSDVKQVGKETTKEIRVAER
jgi:hypothetical protein